MAERLIAEKRNVDHRYPASAMALLAHADVQSSRIGETIGSLYPRLPEMIYHYTSAEACLKIIESGELWMTHVDFTNDAREFKLGCDAIGTLLTELISKASLGEEREALEVCQSQLPHIRDDTAVFLACFSAGRDRLSQWRGYASEGYALGFNRKAMEAHATELGHSLYHCLYKPEHHQVVGKVAVEVVMDTYKQLLAAGSKNDALIAIGILFEIVTTLVTPLMKDEAFSEEDEWRLVTPPNHIQWAAKLSFARKGRRIVPHDVFPLKREGAPRLLSEVMVAPPSQDDAAKTGLLWSLAHYGFDGTEVTGSAIEFRPS